MNNQPNNGNSSDAQPVNKNRSKRKKIYGLVGGAALALAVTFGGSTLLPTINSVSAQSATTTPSNASPQTTPTSGSSTTQLQGPAFGGPRDQGRGGGKMGQRNGASGTISAISGNTITLKQGDVIVVQATVNANTVYTKAGQTISLSDLKVGQKASVRTTTDSSGTVLVAAVDIVLDRASGTISALDASSVTITKADNTTIKATLSSTTSYQDLGQASSLANLKSGMRVEIAGLLNSDGTLSAEVINVQHDRLGGTITAINGNSLIVRVEGPGGNGKGPGRNKPGDAATTPGSPTTAPSTATTTATVTKTITVDSSTVYLEGGQSIKLSDLAVGDKINAAGALSSDGNSLSALQVTVQLPHYQGQVTNITGSTIVIQDRSGTRTIEVNTTTKYLNGQASAALSDIKVGSNLGVEGKVDANGKMTASMVQLGQVQGGPQGQGPKGARH